ncbi:hypothetical protein F5Y16DRAFT_27918 [Xylariaceae sp. FL0255]|nr:hypothetical protein F5Y16DRAFT_27918 [Xylariaceae sp. FL0255]
MMPVTKKGVRIAVAAVLGLIILVQFIPSINYRASLAHGRRYEEESFRDRFQRVVFGTDAGIKSTAELFSAIYKEDLWRFGDKAPDMPFYSGPGSHDADTVEPYVNAVRSFLARTFAKPPNVADLGCGDFNIGRQIRNMTNRYTACDIVPELIQYNKIAFAQEENVDFRVVDMISQDLPRADVVLIRQVLQHLSNEQILSIVPKLYQYQWAVITEHLPFEDDFIPNMDIRTGSVRLGKDSGLELTAAPFRLQHFGAPVLCETMAVDGRIRTTAYRLWNT